MTTKKSIAVTCSLVAVLSIATLSYGCSSSTSSQSLTSEKENTPTPTPTQTPIPHASIVATEGTDSDLAQYKSYEEFDVSSDAYGVKVLLTTDETVKDFTLFRIQWDEGTQQLTKGVGSVLYHLEEFTKEKPIVLTVSFPGSMPTVCFEYKDTDGTQKGYDIYMSGMDGSIQLEEALHETVVSEPETVTPATVSIEEATNYQLSQYANYYEFNGASDEYGIRLLLTTDTTVKDLTLFDLTWDEETQQLTKGVGSILYHLEEFTKEEPLVLTLSFPGLIPTKALDYMDTDGTTKHYHIAPSGEDGMIHLLEVSE